MFSIVLNTIRTIILKNGNYKVILAVVFTIIICSLLFNTCNDNSINNLEKVYKQNISALQDSIRVYETKNGHLVYEKKSLISDKKNLGDYSKKLESEIKKLKDNPIVIINYNTEIITENIDISVISDSINKYWANDSSYSVMTHSWLFDTIYNPNNYRKMNGIFTTKTLRGGDVSVSKFRIVRDEIGMSFTTGLTESRNGMLEIFITSDFPGFKPTNIEGALINPRESKVIKSFFPPKRWGLGIQGGYGLYVDIHKNRVGHAFNLGVGVNYNIIQWNFNKKR